jgi:hypothetical protein
LVKRAKEICGKPEIFTWYSLQRGEHFALSLVRTLDSFFLRDKSIKAFDLRYIGVENFAAVRKCQADKAIFCLKWHCGPRTKKRAEKDIFIYSIWQHRGYVNILWTHLARARNLLLLDGCIINSSSHMACILHARLCVCVALGRIYVRE